MEEGDPLLRKCQRQEVWLIHVYISTAVSLFMVLELYVHTSFSVWVSVFSTYLVIVNNPVPLQVEKRLEDWIESQIKQENEKK